MSSCVERRARATIAMTICSLPCYEALAVSALLAQLAIGMMCLFPFVFLIGPIE